MDAGARCAFVLADALYGADSRIRRMLEVRHQPYVLATRSNHALRLLTNEGLEQTDPLTLAEALPPEAWAPHAAGEGSKGPQLYDWARIALPWTVDSGFERWVLIRRSRRDASERAYYLVFARTGTTLAELAGAAGLRWTIEACFQRAKEELGLEHCRHPPPRPAQRAADPRSHRQVVATIVPPLAVPLGVVACWSVCSRRRVTWAGC